VQCCDQWHCCEVIIEENCAQEYKWLLHILIIVKICLTSETTKWILIKTGFEGLHCNLSHKFNSNSYLLKITLNCSNYEINKVESFKYLGSKIEKKKTSTKRNYRKTRTSKKISLIHFRIRKCHRQETCLNYRHLLPSQLIMCVKSIPSDVTSLL
jgi:hypothetical protein